MKYSSILSSAVSGRAWVEVSQSVLAKLGAPVCAAIFGVSLSLAPVLHASTVVTVFRDFNGNGTQEAGEPGVSVYEVGVPGCEASAGSRSSSPCSCCSCCRRWRRRPFS